MKVLLFLAALLTVSPALAAPKAATRLDTGWQVRIDPADTDAAKAHPRAAAWLPASVPGTVQQDLIALGIVPDPFKGTNEAQIQWAGLTGWQYRRTLAVTPAMMTRDHLDLVFDGLDTFATVRINGRVLLSADNAHRRWRADAKPLLRAGANDLTINFASPIAKLAPLVRATKYVLPGEYISQFGDDPDNKQTSPYIRKPKYQYGWDWAPRIVTVGPWREVRMEAWDDARIDTLLIRQEVVNAAEARIIAELRVVADATRRADVRVIVTGPDGRRLVATRAITLAIGDNRVTVPLTIARPAIWQPLGFGAHPLYTVAATLVEDRTETDATSRRTGLRVVELIRDGGAFGLKINGNTIFMKGANVIPFDAFPSRVTAVAERKLLTDAAAANMNMVRIWGGGYYPDDAFYDAADALGLMIWQDFMFGGSVTPADAEFRRNVAAEAIEQVERVQAHPSLVIWAGNNEVQSGWENWSDRKAFKQAVGPDEQERIGVGMAVLFDRVLRDAVTRGDGDVPYWPGSPSTDYEGPIDTDKAGDRHFWDVWAGSKPIERYTDSCARFMSEYGFQGFPNLSTIARFADIADFRSDSAVMMAHQKFLSGKGNERVAFYLGQYMRDPRDFADLVYLSQALQARAIGIAARHHRACRPKTLGSLYWQLNDVWPAISWSSIDWFGQWKLLHYEARRFFAPQAVVAEYRDGKTRVALLSDAITPIAARWRLRAFAMDGRLLGERGGVAMLAPGSARDMIDAADADLFGDATPAESYAVAELIVGGRTVSRQMIERLVPREMHYPAPGLTARWDGKRLTITAAKLARAVGISFGTVVAQPSDNGFDLLPGESTTVTIDSGADANVLASALWLATLGSK